MHADCKASKGIRNHICCKTGIEFYHYYKEINRWYCHFDDDVYVNIPMLVTTLAEYNPLREKVYIGRWPRPYKNLPLPRTKLHHVSNVYQYATGASYCVSAVLMKELEEFLSGSKFLSACKMLGVNEDMTLGSIIVGVLGYDLTNNVLFGTHLNSMEMQKQQLLNQITVSYSIPSRPQRPGKKKNVLNISTPFSETEDPTRFFSYHCLLHPNTNWCRHCS